MILCFPTGLYHLKILTRVFKAITSLLQETWRVCCHGNVIIIVSLSLGADFGVVCCVYVGRDFLRANRFLHVEIVSGWMCMCVLMESYYTWEADCVCVYAVTHRTEVSNEIAICQHSFLCQFEDMRRFRKGQESHRAEVLLTAATEHCSPIVSLLLGRYSQFSVPCVCDGYKYYIHLQWRWKTVSADK